MILAEKMAVVRHHTKGADETLRIVAVDRKTRQICIIPALTNKKVWPRWEDLDDWEQAVRQGQIEQCKTDPHAELFDSKYEHSDFVEQFGKYIERRDFRYFVIEPLIANRDILYRHTRGALISARVEEIQALNLPGENRRASKNSINKWLRLFLQGGMRPNALIPRWEWNRRGGRKRKEPANLRLKQFKDKKGRIWFGIQAAMAWGLHTFRSTGLSLENIRIRINAKYFSHGEVLKDGIPMPVLKKHHISKWKLRHFFRKYWDKAQDLRSQIGDDEWDSNHRPLTGTANLRASAPGDCFQMDVTELPIILVAKLNSALELGQAVLCLVIDQFTGLICGFSIRFGAEDAMLYRLAIDHAHTNKVAWCKHRGRTIRPEEWPCEHLAKTYVTDRGLLRKWLGNQLVNTLGIDMENGPAYRPDLRGLVESTIKVIKNKARKLAGATSRPRTPGRHKKRPAPSLTIDQIEEIVMNEAICHNKRVLKDLRLTKAMVRDRVPRVPIKLWAWAINAIGGSLTQEDVNTLRLNLLPYEYGSITKQGLKFHKRLYKCDMSLVEKARREGNIKVLVHYHPYYPDEIYRRIDHRTTAIEVCRLSKGDSAWIETSDEEHAAVMKDYQKLDAKAQLEYEQARAEADARNDDLQKKARRKHANDQRDLGVTKNIQRGKAARREAEQARRDEENAWSFSDKQETTTVSPPSANDNASDDIYWEALDHSVNQTVTPQEGRTNV